VLLLSDNSIYLLIFLFYLLSLLSLIFYFFGLINGQNLLKIILIFTLRFKNIHLIFISGQITDLLVDSVIQFVIPSFHLCAKRDGLVIIRFFRVNLVDWLSLEIVLRRQNLPFLLKQTTWYQI